MKKLFLSAAVAVSTLTFAQQFGVKGGLNVSSISDEGFSESNSKTGFYAGVFMNAPIAESFSIQPEVLYNNLGAKYTTNLGPLGTYEDKLSLDYISVPVMLQYNVVPQFYLEAGPELGFLVNAKSDRTYTGDIEANDTQQLDTDDFNKFNFGLGIGAGFNITQNFGVNARYVAGFSDVTDENSDPSPDANNKNNTFQVGLSYKF